MILRGDRHQWHMETLAINTVESIYLHPGTPDQDGDTEGYAAHNHIILKEWAFWGNSTDARLEAIILHFLGGGQEYLLNVEGSCLQGSGRDAESAFQAKCVTEINLLRSIEFRIRNTDTENTDVGIVMVTYELVK